MSFLKRAWIPYAFAVLTLGGALAAAARDTAAAPRDMLPSDGVAAPDIALPALDRLVSRLAADARTTRR